MAVLALAAGGAFLTGSLGMGWQAGWLIGSTIGTLLFGPKGKSTVEEGPRLGDLSVQSSTYGQPIPWAYGTIRLAGNVIWSTGIIEQKNVETRRVGGKGFGKKPTHTTITYDYFTSMAIGFAEGEAEDVLRIWADGKLIFDKTSTNLFRSPGLNFRFYPGNETQLPDGTIQAKEGSGQVPGHRGLCYIVFRSLPLKQFGNRVPNITAEITFKRQVDFPYLRVERITHPTLGTVANSNEFAVDWLKYRMYQSSGNNGIRVVNLDSMIEERVVTTAELQLQQSETSIGYLYSGADDFLYFSVGISNRQPIVKVSSESLTEVARYGTQGSSVTDGKLGAPACNKMSLARCYGPNGLVNFLIAGGLPVFNKIVIVNTNGMEYVDEFSPLGSSIQEIVSLPPAGLSTKSYVITGPGQFGGKEFHIAKIEIDWNAIYKDPADYPTLDEEVRLGVTYTDLVTYDCDDFFAEPGNIGWDSVFVLTGDQSDESLIILLTEMDTDKTAVFKWNETDGVVWLKNDNDGLPNFGNFRGANYAEVSRVTGSKFAHPQSDSDFVIEFDLTTGDFEKTQLATGFLHGSAMPIYDSETESIISSYTVPGDISIKLTKLFLNRGGGQGENLGFITQDICNRVGLSSTDLDVSELDVDVKGYVVSRPTSSRSALEPLMLAYFFDGVESDNLLRFKPRGRASSATIPQRDLAIVNDDTGEYWTEQRQQEVELPERMNVIYIDKDRDYQQGAQFSKRIANPSPAMYSRDQQGIEVPIVLDATEAKQIAEKALYTTWVERTSYSGQVSWKYLYLDATDVVTTELDSGSTYISRISKFDIGQGYSIEFESIAEDINTFSSSSIADGGAGVFPQVIPTTAASKLILLDLPILREIDAVPDGLGFMIYLGASGYGLPGWPGALIVKSPDNVAYTDVTQVITETARGRARNALADPQSPFKTDLFNTLTVFMTTGKDQLESVSYIEMLNGANAAVLINSNDEPEIIQFQEVTENTDGSFTLSKLLRGRRGTDVYANNHSAGDEFILLDSSWIEAILLPISDRGNLNFWRAIGFNTLFEDSLFTTFTPVARALMPYAPVFVTAQETLGDIEISWVRRTRIDGELKDGTGEVPLFEDEEKYEVDIMDGLGVVIRTLFTTTDSVVYTNADILTDFGSVPSEIQMAVYQISAAVGRGFAYTVTVLVE